MRRATHGDAFRGEWREARLELGYWLLKLALVVFPDHSAEQLSMMQWIDREFKATVEREGRRFW